MEGYVFSAPVLKEREYRLDGLFLPPADQPELPALILEAQMAADPGFLLRLNAETARLLQQQDRQGRAIRHWRVVVICPSRDLNFGDPTSVREFVERRVVWIELAAERLPPEAPPLQRALGMLLLPEEQLRDCSASIRAEAAGTSLGAELDDVIAAILLSRFSGRTVPEICAMGGITVDDFTRAASPTARFSDWAFTRGAKWVCCKASKKASDKAAKPKPPPSPCASSSVAAAASALPSNPASRRCPSAISKPWPMPCSISRGQKTSMPG